MGSENIRMSQEQAQRISKMLLSQGIAQPDIDKIIYGEYETFDTVQGMDEVFGDLKKYGDVLEVLSDGYTFDELKSQGIPLGRIQDFQKMMTERNFSAEDVKAIYQYSNGSKMILGRERGVEKETIQESILHELEEKLQMRGVSKENIEQAKEFVKNVDYQQILHSNYDRANEYMERIGMQSNAIVSVRTAIKSMDRCAHIDETICSLEEALGKTSLSKSIRLYRAVKGDYLRRIFPDKEDLRSLIGEKIDDNGQTSTSPLYDASFAKYKEYDTVLEIYAPQGTRGTYIPELSAYEGTEQEVLLNPNDLYITNVQPGVIDKNGMTKNIIQALALSKDRECYKNIGQAHKDSELREEAGTKLPAVQNIFSRIFGMIKERFARRKTQKSQPKDEHIPQVRKDTKKYWKLEPEEKARLQKQTIEIAKRHQEQQTKQPTIKDMGERD